jgi:hypothetical protein
MATRGRPRTTRNPLIRKLKNLEANYHPDSVKFIVEKHGYDATPEQAETADQEWASNRAKTFSREISRGDAQSVESLMQEPPLGAGIPLKRSEEFDYAKKNLGLEGMAVSESAGETEQRFSKRPSKPDDTNLGSI